MNAFDALLIINKVRKMVDQMSKPSHVGIIIKYSINAAKMMRYANTKTENMLFDSLPYGMRLRVLAGLSKPS